MKKSGRSLIVIIIAIILSSCTMPIRADNADTNTVTEEACMDAEITTIAKVIGSEKTARIVLEEVHNALPGSVVVGATEYSDETGSGLQLTMETNTMINVYMEANGYPFAITDASTGEYLLAIYQ